MTRRTSHPIAIAIAVLALAAGTGAAPPKLPVVEGRDALAKVNGEPVWLDAFTAELSSIHGAMAAEPTATVRRRNPIELLDRLIAIKLIVQEGRNIGLDELPEVVQALDAYRAEALRDELFRVRTQALTTPDPQEVERRCREALKEVELRSALLPAEADAQALVAAVRGGDDFAAEVGRLAAAGKVQDSHEPRFVRRSELLPEVASAVDALAPGEVGGPIRVGSAFTVVRLSAVRYADDPEARRTIEREVLHQERSDAARRYVAELQTEHARIDEPLLAGLDFEATGPGFAVLIEDRRPLARIAGEDPVTVADLAQALQKKFFHGVDRAAEGGRINARKQGTLDDLLNRRVVIHEARRQKLDRTPRYADLVREKEESLIFGLFVQKVIDPTIRADEAALRAYLAEHAAEYTSPEMMRLERLTFARREDAEATLAKLRQGADWGWTRENSRGQLDAAAAAAALDLPPGPVVVSTLPEGLRKALQGAAPGDFRFYGDAAGPYHVIGVREVVAPQPRPFETVRDNVGARVFGERRQRAIDDWTARLRAASEIEVFVTRDELEQRLGFEGVTK